MSEHTNDKGGRDTTSAPESGSQYYLDQYEMNNQLHPCVSLDGEVIAVCPATSENHSGKCGHLTDLITSANVPRSQAGKAVNYEKL